MIAGGSHQRHARQKETSPVESLELSRGKVSDVFVVRGIWVNELSFDRSLRPFNHLYAITLRIVLNFVHDVVDEENATARGAEEIGRITRIGNLANVETLAFVFDSKTRFFGRQFRRDLQQLGGIVLVSVFDSVDECFVESNEEIRSFRPNQTALRYPILQVLEYAVHQAQVARKFKLDLLVNVRKNAGIVNETEFVREGLFDYLAQLLAVIRQSQVIGSAHFEGPDFVFGEVADNQIEAVEVVAADCPRAFTGHDHFMTETPQRLFENTQLIAIIYDENPAFIHQAPILSSS